MRLATWLRGGAGACPLLCERGAAGSVVGLTDARPELLLALFWLSAAV